MSYGHSWSDIKLYTLSEIGVFIRSIYAKSEREKIEKFSFDWMASNLTHEGMEKVVDSMKKKSLTSPEKPKTKEEVADQWQRLASLSMG